MELTADVIKRRSGHYDVSLVALLDVSQMRIRRLGQLESCVNLLELNLEHNELRSLEGFPSLSLLRCLYVSDNQLTSIDTLPSLPALEELLVASNKIRSIDFTGLATKLPRLRALDFRCNPLDASATTKAFKAFPNLFTLNGEAITLTKLFEEISADNEEPSIIIEEDAALKNPIDESDSSNLDVTEDDIGVNQFIGEATQKLKDLLQQCKHAMEASAPELIFPAD